MDIRHMEREHLDAVLEMVWSMEDAFYGRDMTGAEAAMGAVANGDRAEGDFSVAVSAGRPVGAAGFRRRPDTDRVYYLSFFAVAARVRGRRVGSRLLETLEDSLRTCGARLLLAESSQEAYAGPARRFYLAQGFDLVAQVDDFWQDGDGLSLFVKRLDPAAGSSSGGRR